MKNLILTFTLFSAVAFGQQKRNLELIPNDSLAVKNVNSIVDYSKKAFYKSGSDLNLKSELQNNVNQLLINNNNFDNINGGRYGDNTTPWSLMKPIVNVVSSPVKTLTTIPVYKSK